MSALASMHQTEQLDALFSDKWVSGVFFTPVTVNGLPNSARVKVLCEEVAQVPLFPRFWPTIEGSQIAVTGGIVHDVYVQPTRWPLKECQLFLISTAFFPEAEGERRPGPSRVQAEVRQIGLDDERPFTTTAANDREQWVWGIVTVRKSTPEQRREGAGLYVFENRINSNAEIFTMPAMGFRDLPAP